MQIIQLDPPATLAAAAAALRRAQPGDKVLLMLPAQPDELAHEIRLQVLRRQADTYQVQVGLVTEDPDVRYHARVARIPTFDSATAAERRWRYPRSLPPLPSPDSVRPFVINPPADVGLDSAAPTIVTKPGATVLAGHTRRRRRHWWLSALGYLGLIAILAAALAGLAVLIVPQATVVVVPARTRSVSSIDLTARIGIDSPDYLNRALPARSVQSRVEGFMIVESTGAADAPVGRATGAVTFVNQTGRQIEVPAETIVRTTTGQNVRFRVVAAVTAPAGVGQQVTAAIEAVEPGRQGNIPALTINEIEGPLNVSLRASNQAPTQGGTVQSVAVVTQADKDRVLALLQEQLERQAYSRLAESLRQGELIPNETVRTFVLAETYDHFAGAQAPELGLQLQLLARGTAVDMAGAAQLAERGLRESIAPGYVLLEDSIRLGQPNFTRFGNETIAFSITASGDTLAPVRAGAVRNLLAGVPLDQAGAALERNLQLAAPPIITLEPNWLNRMPYVPTRINVRVLQE